MTRLYLRAIASFAGCAVIAATAVARTAVAGDPGQAPALRITAPTRDTVISGATRIEVAVEPQDAAAAVQTVMFSVDGRLACTVANRNLTVAEWQHYLSPQPYRRTCGGLVAG